MEIIMLEETNSNCTKAVKKKMIVNRMKAVAFIITIISYLAARI